LSSATIPVVAAKYFWGSFSISSKFVSSYCTNSSFGVVSLVVRNKNEWWFVTIN
jgi:hypothetical protein